jgi:L-ascorbate metabolism protein UlaG (beta-lactamase superfamily)
MKRAGRWACMATLTWLGHAGFLVEADGRRAVVDAWRNAPTWPDVPLDGLDFVLVTHGHYDHAESAPQLCADGATLVCIHEVTFWAKGRGVPEDQIVGMNIGGKYEQDGWRFTMVQAVHSGGCPGPDEHGHHIVPGGAAAGFVIETPDGARIYHAGDTAIFLDMQLIAELWRPDVALLPIGGRFTMDPRAAAKAVELLRVKHVVPMHYGTYPALAGTPLELRAAVPRGTTVHALAPGESLDLDDLA